jgi:hypothetical protein
MKLKKFCIQINCELNFIIMFEDLLYKILNFFYIQEFYLKLSYIINLYINIIFT